MSKENGILDLVLKAEWFEKIKSGAKTIEYREVKKFWGERIFAKAPYPNLFSTHQVVDKVLFSKGYARKEQMLFKIKRIEVLPSGKNTDLKIDKPVYAIYLGRLIEIKWGKNGK